MLVLFDEMTRRTLFDCYPRLKAAVILLGDLLGIGEIPDPIDGGTTRFVRVYDQIAAAVDELVRLMPRSAAADPIIRRRERDAEPSGERKIGR